jgi:hypothetical protein
MRTHQEIDERSLALHRRVADAIRHDPARFDRARAILRHWREVVSPDSQPYLREWERLLAQGVEASLAAALERSEHAAALRQCSPLAGVLTSRERFAFLRTWSHPREAPPT